MRILALCKRQYTNLDLIDDKFGRLRELPIALAQLGHDVSGICLSYRSRREGVYDDIRDEGRVRWYSLDLKRVLPFGAKSYLRILNRIIKKKPDVIWASSDAFHIIMGSWIARKYNIPFVADLYDNYESFLITQLVGVKKLLRYSLKSAEGICCVSRPLAEYVRETTAFAGPIEVIENAVPEGLFYPMDKLSCRRKLGLPNDGFFIGTAGAISKSRGIEVLLSAFERMYKQNPNIFLVLAGPCDLGLVLPQNKRIHYLGVLPPDKIPIFLSALDVQVICNQNSSFGKYCFPQKFYEAVACQVPVVAAGVGSMLEKLENHSDHLFEVGNVKSLESVLYRQVQNPSLLPLKVPTWNIRGKQLDYFLQNIHSNKL